MSDEHKDEVADRVGVYYKYKRKDYRSECQGCGRGYHSHRWQAHHVLPGVVFGDLDEYVEKCLAVTDFNINKSYSMAGLPTLKAFILYFQNDSSFPIFKAKEKLVQMRRWGDIRVYKYQKDIPLTFPGNFPCHQPVSFGHVIYNDDVKARLNRKIWKPLKKNKKQGKHFDPKDVRDQLISAQQYFWDGLVERGSGAGGGGHTGIEANLRNRYGSSKSGWWKPMCMAEVGSAPVSPSLA